MTCDADDTKQSVHLGASSGSGVAGPWWALETSQQHQPPLRATGIETSSEQIVGLQTWPSETPPDEIQFDLSSPMCSGEGLMGQTWQLNETDAWWSVRTPQGEVPQTMRNAPAQFVPTKPARPPENSRPGGGAGRLRARIEACSNHTTCVSSDSELSPPSSPRWCVGPAEDVFAQATAEAEARLPLRTHQMPPVMEQLLQDVVTQEIDGLGCALKMVALRSRTLKMLGVQHLHQDVHLQNYLSTRCKTVGVMFWNVLLLARALLAFRECAQKRYFWRGVQAVIRRSAGRASRAADYVGRARRRVVRYEFSAFESLMVLRAFAEWERLVLYGRGQALQRALADASERCADAEKHRFQIQQHGMKVSEERQLALEQLIIAKGALRVTLDRQAQIHRAHIIRRRYVRGSFVYWMVAHRRRRRRKRFEGLFRGYEAQAFLGWSIFMQVAKARTRARMNALLYLDGAYLLQRQGMLKIYCFYGWKQVVLRRHSWVVAKQNEVRYLVRTAFGVWMSRCQSRGFCNSAALKRNLHRLYLSPPFQAWSIATLWSAADAKHSRNSKCNSQWMALSFGAQKAAVGNELLRCMVRETKRRRSFMNLCHTCTFTYQCRVLLTCVTQWRAASRVKRSRRSELQKRLQAHEGLVSSELILSFERFSRYTLIQRGLRQKEDFAALEGKYLSHKRQTQRNNQAFIERHVLQRENVVALTLTLEYWRTETARRLHTRRERQHAFKARVSQKAHAKRCYDKLYLFGHWVQVHRRWQLRERLDKHFRGLKTQVFLSWRMCMHVAKARTRAGRRALFCLDSVHMLERQAILTRYCFRTWEQSVLGKRTRFVARQREFQYVLVIVMSVWVSRCRSCRFCRSPAFWRAFKYCSLLPTFQSWLTVLLLAREEAIRSRASWYNSQWTKLSFGCDKAKIKDELLRCLVLQRHHRRSVVNMSSQWAWTYHCRLLLICALRWHNQSSASASRRLELQRKLRTLVEHEYSDMALFFGCFLRFTMLQKSLSLREHVVTLHEKYLVQQKNIRSKKCVLLDKHVSRKAALAAWTLTFVAWASETACSLERRRGRQRALGTHMALLRKTQAKQDFYLWKTFYRSSLEARTKESIRSIRYYQQALKASAWRDWRYTVDDIISARTRSFQNTQFMSLRGALLSSMRRFFVERSEELLLHSFTGWRKCTTDSHSSRLRKRKYCRLAYLFVADHVATFVKSVFVGWIAVVAPLRLVRLRESDCCLTGHSRYAALARILLARCMVSWRTSAAVESKMSRDHARLSRCVATIVGLRAKVAKQKFLYQWRAGCPWKEREIPLQPSGRLDFLKDPPMFFSWPMNPTFAAPADAISAVSSPQPAVRILTSSAAQTVGGDPQEESRRPPGDMEVQEPPLLGAVERHQLASKAILSEKDYQRLLAHNRAAKQQSRPSTARSARPARAIGWAVWQEDC